MAVTATATLDANTLGANGAEITTTTETTVTLYTIEGAGSHDIHRITLEYSPDGGANWFASPHSLNGHGHFMTEIAVADRIRACVCKAEGSASSVDVVIMAR